MDKLGVGVVGPGWAGGEHIRAYMSNPNVEIVALCGRDEGRTRAKMQECDLECDVYTDYEEMLKANQSGSAELLCSFMVIYQPPGELSKARTSATIACIKLAKRFNQRT